MQVSVTNQIPSDINKLSKFNITGKIKKLCNQFQRGTRQWFFDELLSWFEDEQSRVMILTAGPGVGKSVLSAKACELYKERNQLAACHFCDFKILDSRNPHRILQSLASQMCDNIERFHHKLTEVFRREHSRDSLADAFRVLLSEPSHALDRQEPVLIVVDALDESNTEAKSELLELISEEFPELPQWVKILITSRPELQVRKKLEHFNPVEILPDDSHHARDLKHFFQQRLPNLNGATVNSLISKCEGSFLYAYHLVNELQKRDLGIEPNLDDIVPKGISGFFEKQFKRLQKGLLDVIPNTGSFVLKSFVNIVAASNQSLPIKILFTGMGLSSKDYNVRETIISVMSEILPLYDDCLTVYHKSLWDWLTLNGYEEHAFVADVQDGVRRLWGACKGVYQDIDSFESFSHFQMTPEKMFALQNGGRYLLDVGDADDFRWLVHIRLDFLKLKYFNHLTFNAPIILNFYKSKRANLHYWKIIHLESFSNTIDEPWPINHLSTQPSCKHKYNRTSVYLQPLANGYFDFMQRKDYGKNEARDILNEFEEIWVEEIGNEYIPKHTVISYVILGPCTNRYMMDVNVAISSNKMLLAYVDRWYFEVLNLPSFKRVFKLDQEFVPARSYPPLFSPDSSYLLCGSLRFCISLRDRKVVPFIPHGPDDIYSCSFSPCGMKLVTFEKSLVKVWDLKRKNILVQAETRLIANHCLYSDCNSYILAWQMEAFDFKDIAVLRANSLERLDIDDIDCADSCLNAEDNYQIIFPPCYGSLPDDAEFQIRHFRLSSSEILLIANKFCSKPFMWKDRKCVIYLTFSRIAVVYDCINKEVVEKFCINCLPSHDAVIDITHLEGRNFLVRFNHNHAFVLSLENSIGSSVDNFQFFNASKIKCCALSPDNLYVACCYENRVLSIQRVDDGKILKMISLETPAEACWWSDSYLWVVCASFVVKYAYDSPNILGNGLHDCSLIFKKVLRFMEGVLVVRLGKGKTAIHKIYNQKLCPQQIPDLNFCASSAAVSRDGCAVLLYCDFLPEYQLWEITYEDRWELRTTGKFDVGVSWFCLTGEKDSRSSMWMKSEYISILDGYYESVFSIDFPEGTRGFSFGADMRYCYESVVVEGTFAYTNILIIHRYECLYFIKVSDGSMITSLYVGDLLCVRNVSSFYIHSKRMYVFVGVSEVKFLKIHNIESDLLCLEKD